jgi:hypothetical protein
MTLTLPVHLVHAPSFWSSTSCSFTFSFLCVFSSFSVLLVIFVSVFLASSLSLKKLTLNFGCRFNRGYPWFYFHPNHKEKEQIRQMLWIQQSLKTTTVKHSEVTKRSLLRCEIRTHSRRYERPDNNQ